MVQFVQGMSIKDCQQGDQRATEFDNEDASMSHMSDLILWILWMLMLGEGHKGQQS